MNARRDRFREAELFRDVRPSLAANLDQVAGVALLRRGYLEESADALQERCSSRDVSQRVVQAFPTHAGPVRRFDVTLGPNLIRVQNVKQPRGIAAAAGIFKQQGVVEVRLLLYRQPNLPANPHAEHTTPYRMPHWLAFGEVQRVRKG